LIQTLEIEEIQLYTFGSFGGRDRYESEPPVFPIAPPVMDFVKGTPLSKLEERAKELLNDSHESTPCVQYHTLFVAMSEIGYTTIFRYI